MLTKAESGKAEGGKLAAEIRAVAVFCLTYGAHLYTGWSGEKLFKYLAFQQLAGGLIVARAQSRDIEGMLIAWPDSAAEILRREREQEFHFNWRPPMPAAEADAFLLADIIVNGENRQQKAEIVSRLVHTATARWPDWRLRRVFTRRKGRLHELTGAVEERFFANVLPKNS